MCQSNPKVGTAVDFKPLCLSSPSHHTSPPHLSIMRQSAAAQCSAFHPKASAASLALAFPLLQRFPNVSSCYSLMPFSLLHNTQDELFFFLVFFYCWRHKKAKSLDFALFCFQILFLFVAGCVLTFVPEISSTQRLPWKVWRKKLDLIKYLDLPGKLFTFHLCYFFHGF